MNELKNVLVDKYGRGLSHYYINECFGFPNNAKVPATFTGTVIINGQAVHKIASRGQKHRTFTQCPYCKNYYTVGCYPQHWKACHAKWQAFWTV